MGSSTVRICQRPTCGNPHMLLAALENIDELLLTTICLLMVLNAFSVFPSEPLLLAIGGGLRTGHLDFRQASLALATAFLAYVCGSVAFYGTAKYFGAGRLERIWKYLERLPFLGHHFSWTRIAGLLKYGNDSPFVTYGILRNITPVRSVVSVVAGLSNFDIRRFTAYTTIGSLPWFAWWPCAGYLLLDQKLPALVALSVLALLWLCIHLYWQRRLANRNNDSIT